MTKKEYYQMLSTLQIKQDCETLKALNGVMSQPILALSFLPFYSLFADEIQKTIGDNGINFVLNNESPFDISQVRSKLKLFGGDKLSKSKNKIRTIDYIQDEIFKSKLKYSFAKDLKVHYNLGIFFNSDGRVIGNTQYFYYMFQSNKYKCREYEKDEITSFSFTLGTAIGSVSEGLKDFQKDLKIKVKNEVYKVYFKDYNTDRTKFSKFTRSELDKENALLILHVLSAVNFVRFILDNELSVHNTYLIKIKYISMYYALGSIKKILKSSSNKFNNEVKKRLEDVLVNTDAVLNSDFRSCMMHYELVKDECYLIDDNFLNHRIPLFGLVETFFNGISYYDLNNLITCKIIEISDTLEKILNIDNDGMEIL